MFCLKESLVFTIKNTWRDCFEFYVETMPKFELFYSEFEDVIKNI